MRKCIFFRRSHSLAAARARAPKWIYPHEHLTATKTHWQSDVMRKQREKRANNQNVKWILCRSEFKHAFLFVAKVNRPGRLSKETKKKIAQVFSISSKSQQIAIASGDFEQFFYAFRDCINYGIVSRYAKATSKRMRRHLKEFSFARSRLLVVSLFYHMI